MPRKTKKPGFVEKFVKGELKSFKEKQAFKRIVAKKALAAARKERVKQEVRLAIESEKNIAANRLSRFKTKQKAKGKSGGGLSGFANQFQENFKTTFGPPQQPSFSNGGGRKKRKGPVDPFGL